MGYVPPDVFPGGHVLPFSVLQYTPIIQHRAWRTARIARHQVSEDLKNHPAPDFTTAFEEAHGAPDRECAAIELGVEQAQPDRVFLLEVECCFVAQALDLA